MPRILMIVGSLREQSFNRQLAREIERIIGNRAEVEELDWHDVPLMNQDIEWPTPEAVQRARDAVTQADVLWFCSPEYNYQIPGGLKNLLDWLSRPTDEHDRTSPSAIRGKHAVICGAAGKSAAAGMRKQLEALLGILGVEVLGGDSPRGRRLRVQLAQRVIDECAEHSLRAGFEGEDVCLPRFRRERDSQAVATENFDA